MDQNNKDNFSIHKKGEDPLIHKKEIKDITGMITDMAYETESKRLDQEVVEKAMLDLFKKPDYGEVYFVVDNDDKKFSSMNIIGREYKIDLDKTINWINFVYVDKDYRKKGLFKKMLESNEQRVSDSNKYANCVKLYMDKDNTTAGKVYLKTGFRVTDETLYEIDFNSEDTSFLFDETKLDQNLIERKYRSVRFGIVDDMNFDEIIKSQLEEDYYGVLESQNYSIKEKLNNIQKVANNHKLGRVIYLFDVIIYLNFLEPQIKTHCHFIHF